MFPINQLIATLIADLSSFSLGLSIGWLSPAIPQLKRPDSPIGNITLDDSAWMAAMFPISGFISTPLLAYIASAHGRRICILFTAIPFIINGVIVVVAKDVLTLIIGRFIMGIGAAGAMSNLPQYIGDIADPKIRGTLASMIAVGYTLGITTAYIFGGYYTYKSIGWISIGVGALNVLFFRFMPETPVYLLKHGRKEEAAKTLGWLRQCDPLSLSVKLEMDHLLSTLRDDKSMIELAKTLFYTKALRRGFFIVTISLVFQGLSGMIAVHSYSISIFAEGRTALGKEESAIIYGCIQVMGSISTTWLIDRLGRKILLIISSFGMAVFLLIMAVYFDLKDDIDVEPFRWIPIVALSLCVYAYTIGVGGVPFILLSDLLIDEVKNLASMLAIQIVFLEAFVLFRSFAPIMEAYGIHVLFYIFGASSLMNTIVSALVIIETKGKSSQEILDKLSK